jgi:hypothetical protein
VRDDVPTMATVFWKLYLGTQGDVSEKSAAPNHWTFFLSIYTYEKVGRMDNTLMCTIAEAYEE